MDRDKLFADILAAVGQAELERVRATIGSRTLRAALELVVDASAGEARLVIPHYWAVYYHDGRGSVSPVSAAKLVFFDEPLINDPRLAGRYPTRASDLRRLTRDEYLEGLRRNEERRAAGQPPFMFVVDRVGPTAPHPFFDQLAVGSAGRSGRIAAPLFDRHIQDAVDMDPDLAAETKSADLEL